MFFGLRFFKAKLTYRQCFLGGLLIEGQKMTGSEGGTMCVVVCLDAFIVSILVLNMFNYMVFTGV